MSDSDEFVETIKASIKYGLSNRATIIIYGILYIVASALIFLGLIVAVVFYKSLVAWAFFGLTLLPILAMSVLTFGYWIQCMRALISGINEMPGIFDDVPGLAIECVKGIIIIAWLAAPIIVLFLLAVGVMITGIVYHNAFLLVVFIIIVAFALILCLPLGFISFSQQVVYAGTGSLLKGLNPLESVRLIRSNTKGAVMAAGEVILLYIIYYAVTTVLSWLCVTYILVPFLIIPMMGAIMYVMARFYLQTNGQEIQNDPLV